jgi:DNA-binding response OmpR family regulator
MMIRLALRNQFQNKGYSVISIGDMNRVGKILSLDLLDLEFLDLPLPDGEGPDLVEEITAKTGRLQWLL